jgi:hypothetical protein
MASFTSKQLLTDINSCRHTIPANHVQTPGFGDLPAAATAHVYPVPPPARPHAPLASIAEAGSAYAERQTAFLRLFEKSYSVFDVLLALAAALSLACVIHFFSVQLWDLDRV